MEEKKRKEGLDFIGSLTEELCIKYGIQQQGEYEMEDKQMIQKNTVELRGEVCSRFEYSHEVFGEGFYTAYLKVNRLSNVCDNIPIVVSERLIDVRENLSGCIVSISGQFRSYNLREEKIRLVLSVFVHEIEKIEDRNSNAVNNIYLDGYICKTPIYRETPLGREITDVLIAVNRSYGKADYIPCVCWGRNARFAGELPIGTKISVSGRIQSRIYTKKLLDGVEEKRTAYEVSVSKIAQEE